MGVVWLHGEPMHRKCGLPLSKGACPQDVVRDAKGRLRDLCFWHQKIADGLAQPHPQFAEGVYVALRVRGVNARGLRAYSPMSSNARAGGR